MKEGKYVLRVNPDFCIYEFQSRGRRGQVTKIVTFTKVDGEGYYNMGFGDKDEITGEVNNAVTTNNGDMKKILGTLIQIIYFFTQKYPEAWIYIKGSNTVRTRLYRIVISKNIADLKNDFFVLGFYKVSGAIFFHTLSLKRF